jgi:hypothetical protein
MQHERQACKAGESDEQKLARHPVSLGLLSIREHSIHRITRQVFTCITTTEK